MARRRGSPLSLGGKVLTGLRGVHATAETLRMVRHGPRRRTASRNDRRAPRASLIENALPRISAASIAQSDRSCTGSLLKE
jgi:hypothetical protein